MMIMVTINIYYYFSNLLNKNWIFILSNLKFIGVVKLKTFFLNEYQSDKVDKVEGVNVVWSTKNSYFRNISKDKIFII